ncbi:MAG: gamma-glutamyl-gamma-aminobutyrate hydrolase family protein [Synergistales bacterium]|nr:gamma-glutamyl-gamma-aminobutyrate hydrolase family protein [Synergistales bacterium]
MRTGWASWRRLSSGGSLSGLHPARSPTIMGGIILLPPGDVNLKKTSPALYLDQAEVRRSVQQEELIMGRPVIGIVGNLLVEQGGFSPGMERSYVNNDYVAAVERAGGIPLILPVVRGQDVAERQTECADALLISGGYDIDPLLYGEEPHRALEFVYRDTDIFQLRTIKTALAKGQPLLAICKGIQLLNVACGGTIYQDLDEIPDSFVKHSQNRKRSCPSHTVVAEEGSVIAELLGTSFPVNSYHHQAVKDVGRGLKVTSRAMDGVTESLEMEGESFVVGVQWHPEMMMSGGDDMLPLFLRLVEEAEKFAAKP